MRNDFKPGQLLVAKDVKNAMYEIVEQDFRLLYRPASIKPGDTMLCISSCFRHNMRPTPGYEIHQLYLVFVLHNSVVKIVTTLSLDAHD